MDLISASIGEKLIYNELSGSKIGFCLRSSMKSTPLVIVDSVDSSIESEKATVTSSVPSENESPGESILPYPIYIILIDMKREGKSNTMD